MNHGIHLGILLASHRSYVSVLLNIYKYSLATAITSVILQ